MLHSHASCEEKITAKEKCFGEVEKNRIDGELRVERDRVLSSSRPKPVHKSKKNVPDYRNIRGAEVAPSRTEYLA
jgi:hypothetical protein